MSKGYVSEAIRRLRGSNFSSNGSLFTFSGIKFQQDRKDKKKSLNILQRKKSAKKTRPSHGNDKFLSKKIIERTLLAQRENTILSKAPTNLRETN